MRTVSLAVVIAGAGPPEVLVIDSVEQPTPD